VPLPVQYRVPEPPTEMVPSEPRLINHCRPAGSAGKFKGNAELSPKLVGWLMTLKVSPDCKAGPWFTTVIAPPELLTQLLRTSSSLFCALVRLISTSSVPPRETLPRVVRVPIMSPGLTVAPLATTRLPMTDP